LRGLWKKKKKGGSPDKVGEAWGLTSPNIQTAML